MVPRRLLHKRMLEIRTCAFFHLKLVSPARPRTQGAPSGTYGVAPPGKLAKLPDRKTKKAKGGEIDLRNQLVLLERKFAKKPLSISTSTKAMDMLLEWNRDLPGEPRSVC